MKSERLGPVDVSDSCEGSLDEAFSNTFYALVAELDTTDDTFDHGTVQTLVRKTLSLLKQDGVEFDREQVQQVVPEYFERHAQGHNTHCSAQQTSYYDKRSVPKGGHHSRHRRRKPLKEFLKGIKHRTWSVEELI